MATPYSHVQITHLTRMGRRRSQSVMIPNTYSRDQTAGQSTARKAFLAQLKKERMKHQSKHDEQAENPESQEEQKENQYDERIHRPVVSRIAKSTRTLSMREIAASAGVTVTKLRTELLTKSTATPTKSEVSIREKAASAGVTVTKLNRELSIKPKRSYMKTAEHHDGHQSSDIELPHIGITASLENVNGATSAHNDSSLDSSQVLIHPFHTSSTHLLGKSETSDQEHMTTDNKHHIENHSRTQKTITTIQRGKNQNIRVRRFYNRSGAGFMVGIIGIVVGTIAFAFGLSALILAMILQSTVNGLLANSTSSSSSNTDIASAACSNYTAITDSSRSIYASGYALGCDRTAPFTNQTTPLWFRFTGSGGTTLPLTTPGMNICGSVGTGWYYGQMPSSGSAVNGTACFTWTSGVCAFSVSISVANCGSFYVYQLPPPPICMARYCTI